MYSQSCKTKSAFQHNVMLINECTCTFNTASHTYLSSIAPPPTPPQMTMVTPKKVVY